MVKIEIIKHFKQTGLNLPIFNASVFISSGGPSLCFCLATIEGTYKHYPKRSGPIVYKLKLHGAWQKTNKYNKKRFTFKEATQEIYNFLKKFNLEDLFDNKWDDERINNDQKK